MSSFHTATHAPLSCDTARVTGDEHTVVTVNEGANAPIAVSTDLLQDTRGYSCFVVTGP